MPRADCGHDHSRHEDPASTPQRARRRAVGGGAPAGASRGRGERHARRTVSAIRVRGVPPRRGPGPHAEATRSRGRAGRCPHSRLTPARLRPLPPARPDRPARVRGLQGNETHGAVEGDRRVRRRRDGRAHPRPCIRAVAKKRSQSRREGLGSVRSRNHPGRMEKSMRQRSEQKRYRSPWTSTLSSDCSSAVSRPHTGSHTSRLGDSLIDFTSASCSPDGGVAPRRLRPMLALPCSRRVSVGSGDRCAVAATSTPLP